MNLKIINKRIAQKDRNMNHGGFGGTNQMRNRKSSGTDGIPAEVWKAAGEEGVDLLWRLCTLIWKSQEWPKD